MKKQAKIISNSIVALTVIFAFFTVYSRAIYVNAPMSNLSYFDVFQYVLPILIIIGLMSYIQYMIGVRIVYETLLIPIPFTRYSHQLHPCKINTPLHKPKQLFLQNLVIRC